MGKDGELRHGVGTVVDAELAVQALVQGDSRLGEQVARGDQKVNAMEVAIGAGPWLLGERFSMADTVLGGTLRFLLTFKMVEPREAFTSYVTRLEARPAFQRAIAKNEGVAAEHNLKR